MICIFRDPEQLPASNYLVIQTPGDPNYGGGPNSSQITSPTNQPPPFGHPPGSMPPPKGGTVVSSMFVKRILKTIDFETKPSFCMKSDCVPFETLKNLKT